MFPNQKIVNLIEALKSGDQDVADALMQDLITTSESRGAYNVSEKLRRVYSLPYRRKQDAARPAGVTDGTRDADNDLYELRRSSMTSADIILSGENRKLLNDLIYSYKNKNKLKKLNIPLDSRVLLHGPPGTGKTMFAYVLAGELGMPLMHINIDRVISSFLGETGKNISSIFKRAQAGGYLVLLDEFDAIAKRRDDDLELGELKRVVTTLLQNLDNLDSDTVIVAATNHEHLLDKAIRRRFPYDINLSYLDDEARLELLELIFRKSNISLDFSLTQLAKISSGLSGAQIVQATNRAFRSWVLNDKGDRLEALLMDEIIRALYSSVTFDSKDKAQVVKLRQVFELTRKVDEERYTYKYLELLCKIPDSSIHYLIAKGA